MKKLLGLSVVMIAVAAWFAFVPGTPATPDTPQGPKSRWIYTKKVLKVKNLPFKEGNETSFIFQFDPLDSLKIRCPECVSATSGEDKTLQITYQGGEGQQMGIGRKRLDKWLPVASITGKFGLIFSAEKDINIGDLEIIRKSDSSKVRPEPDLVPLDVKNLWVTASAEDPNSEKLQFFFDLARKDEIFITAKTVTADLSNLVCDWYKEGEEFDSDIAPFNQSFFIPSDATFFGNYIFEFGVKDGSKKNDNLFNLRVTRIPAPPEEVPVIDPNAEKEDTISAENALLMELIKALTPEEVKEFECAGIATAITEKVTGRLNISPGNQNRKCTEILLSEECADPTESCPHCSFWIYWIGVGEEAINQYHFRDSTRKLITNKGIIESYANAIKFMKVSGSGIFPEISQGEDIYYAIVDEANMEKFMASKQLPPLKGTAPSFAADASGSLVTGFKVLTYQPGQRRFLCLCNNNELSPVPVMFNFQQFLALADTARAVAPKADTEKPDTTNAL